MGKLVLVEPLTLHAVASGILGHIGLVVEVLQTIVLAWLWSIVIAVGQQSFHHFFQSEVLHQCDGPVRTVISRASPLVECGSVTIEIEANIAFEIGFFRDVDVTGCACVVGTRLDVHLHSTATGLTEVVFRVQIVSCAGVAQGVPITTLIQNPYLCQVVLLSLCALYLFAHMSQISIAEPSVGQSDEPSLVEHIFYVCCASQFGYILEAYFTQCPVSVTSCSTLGGGAFQSAAVVLQII